MFAKSVVMCDAFLALPAPARCLYYCLGMTADDDGFVDAPLSVMRMAGARAAHMRILVDMGYVVEFKSGVVALKHWKINNRIRSDRYRGTQYTEEKTLLDEKTDTRRDTNWDTNRDTQDRIGKDSIGKDRLLYAPGALPPASQSDCFRILEAYNRHCPSLPRCTELTPAREQRLRRALDAGRTVEDFVRVFEMAEKSAFLRGGGARAWAASFDWLTRSANMTKVLEGSYDDRAANAVPMGATGVLGPAELEALQKPLRE